MSVLKRLRRRPRKLGGHGLDVKLKWPLEAVQGGVPLMAIPTSQRLTTSLFGLGHTQQVVLTRGESVHIVRYVEGNSSFYRC